MNGSWSRRAAVGGGRSSPSRSADLHDGGGDVPANGPGGPGEKIHAGWLRLGISLCMVNVWRV